MHKQVGYSPSERKLLSLLPRRGVVSSEELVGGLYSRGEAPYHARKCVVGIMASLIRKVEHNREPFKIVKANRQGPVPMEYRRERRT